VTGTSTHDDVTVTVGVPSYNEGTGITPTLNSIADSARTIGLSQWELVVSDSSETTATVGAVEAWRHLHPDVSVRVDRSETRRSLKEALNSIFALCDSDILIATNADVLLEPASLSGLIDALLGPRRPLIAVGSAAPDAEYRALRHRASAWQLRAARRYAASLPPDEPRAEGALWACRREFYESYRFPIGHGALHDDVELMRHASSHGIPMANVWRAAAYKVPAGSLHDFYLQTTRWQQTAGERRRDRGELRAALAEAIRDPVGAVCYAYARAWVAAKERRDPVAHSEHWEVEHTTKR
jgi:glycosyltransferase involved in cell wall biosynthesis